MALRHHGPLGVELAHDWLSIARAHTGSAAGPLLLTGRTLECAWLDRRVAIRRIRSTVDQSGRRSNAAKSVAPIRFARWTRQCAPLRAYSRVSGAPPRFAPPCTQTPRSNGSGPGLEDRGAATKVPASTNYIYIRPRKFRIDASVAGSQLARRPPATHKEVDSAASGGFASQRPEPCLAFAPRVLIPAAPMPAPVLFGH